MSLQVPCSTCNAAPTSFTSKAIGIKAVASGAWAARTVSIKSMQAARVRQTAHCGREGRAKQGSGRLWNKAGCRTVEAVVAVLVMHFTSTCA